MNERGCYTHNPPPSCYVGKHAPHTRSTFYSSVSSDGASQSRENSGGSLLSPPPPCPPREAVQAKLGKGHASKLTQLPPCLGETKARLRALVANCLDEMTDHRVAEFKIFLNVSTIIA